jgi:hypothetical protein
LPANSEACADGVVEQADAAVVAVDGDGEAEEETGRLIGGFVGVSEEVSYKNIVTVQRRQPTAWYHLLLRRETMEIMPNGEACSGGGDINWVS